jgi:hypothetical protein
MLESGPSGSVRGVPSNGHPYRDPRSNAVISQRAVSVGNGPESRRTVDQSMKSQKCRVEVWRGGCRIGLSVPPLSSGGASLAEP